MITAQEWLNKNALRAYPFKEDSPRLSTGNLALPFDVILDFTCFVPTPGVYRLARLVISENTEATFYIWNENNVELGHFTVDLNTPQPIAIESDLAYVTGTVVPGENASILKSWPGGENLLEQAELEASVVIPLSLDVVTSVGIADQDDVLTGHVIIEMGDHLESQIIPAENAIEISSIVRPDCPLKDIDPIKKLNGINCDGNVNVEGKGIMTIRPGGNGISIGSMMGDDKCPKPFEKAKRGPNGGAGGAGPAGPAGACRECRICPPPKPKPIEPGDKCDCFFLCEVKTPLLVRGDKRISVTENWPPIGAPNEVEYVANDANTIERTPLILVKSGPADGPVRTIVACELSCESLMVLEIELLTSGVVLEYQAVEAIKIVDGSCTNCAYINEEQTYQLEFHEESPLANPAVLVVDALPEGHFEWGLARIAEYSNDKALLRRTSNRLYVALHVGPDPGVVEIINYGNIVYTTEVTPP